MVFCRRVMKGGYGMDFQLKCTRQSRYSSISLILLWVSHFETALAAFKGRGMKGWDDSDPPQNSGGPCGPEKRCAFVASLFS